VAKIKKINYRPIILSVLLTWIHFFYLPLAKNGFNEIGMRIGSENLSNITAYYILSFFSPVIVLILTASLALTLITYFEKCNLNKLLFIFEILLLAILFLYLIILPMPALRFIYYC